MLIESSIECRPTCTVITFSEPPNTRFTLEPIQRIYRTFPPDIYLPTFVGHGGALVEAITLNRRVVGSTPALAAMYM